MTKRDMWTEVIAQRVHVEFDKGAVVGLARVPILKDDTVDDLQKRALPEEHGVQIKLMNDIGGHNINEIPMESVLKPGEEVLLEQAKRAAILLYPHG